MNAKIWAIFIVGLIVVMSVALTLYLYLGIQEMSWLRSGAYVAYEQVFVWNGNTLAEYMIWNITRLWSGLADFSLTSHGVNVTKRGVELTVGEANLEIDRDTREVINGSDILAYYIGEKWPFWIETNVSIGSTIDIWYGTTNIMKNESLYVLGQQRDCWIIGYNWTSGCMERWYDKSSGILLKIHNALYRRGITIVITETAVMTNLMKE